jgi:hypothetical protein
MNRVDSIDLLQHVAIQSNLFACKPIPDRGISSRPICPIFARWGKEQHGFHAIEHMAASALAVGKKFVASVQFADRTGIGLTK